MTDVRKLLADALVQAAMEDDKSQRVTVSMRVLEIMTALAPATTPLEPIEVSGDSLGDRLRLARRRVGLSSEVVAKSLGFSPAAVRAHESGQNGAPAYKVAKYANIYRVAPEWLLYGRGDGPIAEQSDN